MTTPATRKKDVTGTWDIEVTLRDCATGGFLKTLHAEGIFSRGGALVETGASVFPGLDGPGHGTWRHVGGKSYNAVLRCYRFDRDGSVVEMQRVTRHLELSDDSSRFTGTACIEVFDSRSRLIRAHCATELANRNSHKQQRITGHPTGNHDDAYLQFQFAGFLEFN